MDLLIASDHAGFELKQDLLDYFLKDEFLRKNFHLIDLGPFDGDRVDYPDYAETLAGQVSTGLAKKGILICGSGAGMSIVANKFPNVRSFVAFSEESAKLCVEHNDVNVLALGARLTKPELAKKIIKSWLSSSFQGERHSGRIEKIKAIEKKLKGTVC